MRAAALQIPAGCGFFPGRGDSRRRPCVMPGDNQKFWRGTALAICARVIASSRAGASRWVWRTFDKPSSKLDALMPLECQVSNEVHILCDTSDTRVTIRGREIEVQVLDHVEVGLELWSTIFTAPFPISREQVTTLF